MSLNKNVMLKAKAKIAERYGKKDWKTVQREYEYGMGISKLLDEESLMEEVAVEYAELLKPYVCSHCPNCKKAL